MPKGDAQAPTRRSRTFGPRQGIRHGRAPRGRESDPPRKHLLLAGARPRRLRSLFPGSRFSPSLRCSNHRKAQIVGRKRNGDQPRTSDVEDARRPRCCASRHRRAQMATGWPISPSDSTRRSISSGGFVRQAHGHGQVTVQHEKVCIFANWLDR